MTDRAKEIIVRLCSAYRATNLNKFDAMPFHHDKSALRELEALDYIKIVTDGMVEYITLTPEAFRVFLNV